MPLLFAGLALWPERGRRRQDLLLRSVVRGAALVIFLLLAAQQPQGMHDLLSSRHWAWIPADWNALAQLPALLFLLATAALGWQAWRHPRPLHTAMLLALLCLWWMLPRIFLQPVLLPALSSAALLLMLGAMLQESFHMAFCDELTGLPGRRAFNETLQRARGTYSIAMVDVDHFKSFNDTHGHDTGDDVLRLVGSRLARVGDGGRAFRYGGEEFAVVFLDRPAAACIEAVEALRQSIEDTRMQLRDRSTRSCDDEAGRQQRGTRRHRPGGAGDGEYRAGRQPRGSATDGSAQGRRPGAVHGQGRRSQPGPRARRPAPAGCIQCVGLRPRRGNTSGRRCTGIGCARSFSPRCRRRCGSAR